MRTPAHHLYLLMWALVCACGRAAHGAQAEVLCDGAIMPLPRTFSLPSAPFVAGDGANQYSLSSSNCSFQKGLVIEMPTAAPPPADDGVRPTITICITDTQIKGAGAHAFYVKSAGAAAVAAKYTLRLSIRNSSIVSHKATEDFNNVYGLSFGDFDLAASAITILQSTIAAVGNSAYAEASAIYFNGTRLLNSSFTVIDSNLTVTVSGYSGFCLRWAEGGALGSNISVSGGFFTVEGTAAVTAFLFAFDAAFSDSIVGVYGSNVSVFARGGSNRVAVSAFFDASTVAEGSVVEFVGTSLNITTLSTYGSTIVAAALYSRNCRLENGAVFRLSDVSATVVVEKDGFENEAAVVLLATPEEAEGTIIAVEGGEAVCRASVATIVAITGNAYDPMGTTITNSSIVLDKATCIAQSPSTTMGKSSIVRTGSNVKWNAGSIALRTSTVQSLGGATWIFQMPFFDATESDVNIVASNLISRSVGGQSKAHLFVFTAATLTRCTIMLRMCDVQCTSHTFDLSRTAYTSVWDFQNSNILGGALAIYDTRCVLTSTSTSPSSAREAYFWAFSDTTIAKAGIESSLLVTVRSQIVFSVGSGSASLIKVLFSGPGSAGMQLITPVSSARFHWRSSTYTIDWGTAVSITPATSSLCPNHCAGLNSPYRVHDGDAEATPELSAAAGATYAASVVAGAARAAAWRSFWPAYWANNSGVCASGSHGDDEGGVTRTITSPLVVSPTLALVSQTFRIGQTITKSPSRSSFVITVTETGLPKASPSPHRMKTETETSNFSQSVPLLKTASKVAESVSKVPAIFTATGTVLPSRSPSLHRVKTVTRTPKSYSPSFVFATTSETVALQASPSSSLSIVNTASKTSRSLCGHFLMLLLQRRFCPAHDHFRRVCLRIRSLFTVRKRRRIH